MMSHDEIAQEVLRRCEKGELQKDACQAVGEQIGVAWRTVLSIYAKKIPKEQRPINGGTQASRRKVDMERRAKRDAQTCVTRCANDGCPWFFDGTVKDGREAHAEHRETCTAERPAIRPHPPRSLERGAVSRPRGEGYEAPAPAIA
jgi:hypothetical protein